MQPQRDSTTLVSATPLSSTQVRAKVCRAQTWQDVWDDGEDGQEDRGGDTWRSVEAARPVVSPTSMITGNALAVEWGSFE